MTPTVEGSNTVTCFFRGSIDKQDCACSECEPSVQIFNMTLTFPIPGCWSRPAALKRHGGAGGGVFLMTSLYLVGYSGRSGSCCWCLFFFFPSFCAARAKKEAAADCWLETDPGEETLENGGGDIA